MVQIFKAGLLSTPAIAYLTKKLNCNLGIVISASHNPYQFNGIKFFNKNGEKLSDSDESKIEKYFFKLTKKKNNYKNNGKIHKGTPSLPDITEGISPDLSIFDARHFLRPLGGKMYNMATVVWTRGSIFRCSYCANETFYKAADTNPKDYYRKKTGIIPKAAYSYIICYYGLRVLPKPFSLIADELDEHFGFEVYNEVEKVNHYFKKCIHKMIEDKN